MKLQPLKTILASSKEKIDELMAGPRERILKAKAEHEMAELEIDIAKKNAEVEELLADKEGFKNFSFKKLLDKLDEIALLERRQGKYKEVLAQLFAKDESNGN